MKIAYFDCFSGASGDMTLGALLDCRPDIEPALRAELAKLNVPGYQLNVARVTREGIAATDVDVALDAADHRHGCHLADIAAILASSELNAPVRERALAIFTRLADAEAKVHGTNRDSIHFHEVGAVDAIVDIVGSCILLDLLGIDTVAMSSVPCGYGTIKCQHGIMPIPAPATTQLLAGFPIRSVDIEGELVTPTGAAIMTTLADPVTAGRIPDMRIVATGYGAGKKQFKPEMPNLLRVIIGETDASASDDTPQTIAVLETNLDDQSPELFDSVMVRAFAAGALDVFVAPIQMKKNRPASLLTVLCPTDKAETLAELLFRETGTFGVRVREQRRYTLERSWTTIETAYGPIRVKVGTRGGEEIVATPEYEDCRTAADGNGVPVRVVFDAARAATTTSRP